MKMKMRKRKRRRRLKNNTGDKRVSKYEKYRIIADKMETVFEENIEGRNKKIRIEFNPVSDNLYAEIPDLYYGEINFKIACGTGKSLFLALKQIYDDSDPV
jgi:hypothetical protein